MTRTRLDINKGDPVACACNAMLSSLSHPGHASIAPTVICIVQDCGICACCTYIATAPSAEYGAHFKSSSQARGTWNQQVGDNPYLQHKIPREYYQQRPWAPRWPQNVQSLPQQRTMEAEMGSVRVHQCWAPICHCRCWSVIPRYQKGLHLLMDSDA